MKALIFVDPRRLRRMVDAGRAVPTDWLRRQGAAGLAVGTARLRRPARKRR